MTDKVTYPHPPFDARARQLLRPMPLAVSTAGVLAVAVVSILLLDQSIAFFLSESISRPAHLIWRDITKIGKSEFYLIFCFGLFLLSRMMMLWTVPHVIATWYNNLARFGLFAITSLLCSGAIVHALKFIFGRIRPKDLINNGEYGFVTFSTNWSYNSFPSGHSQTIFVVAIILSYVLPKYRWAFWIFAAFIAFSRMAVQAHFLSDVIVGSFIGIVSTIFVKEKWFRDIDRLKYNPWAFTDSSTKQQSDS